MLHLNKDWLFKKYIDEGLSTYDIGKLVNRNPKRIYEKLKDFGIPTRKRGLNLKGEDNYMNSGNANPFAGKKHTIETRKYMSKLASVPKPFLREAGNGMYGMIGSLSPRFIDGSAGERQKIYEQSEWKKLKRVLLERDGFICQRCKSTKMLHLHHIKSWAGHKSLRFKPSNIVTLCKPCHNFVHSKKNVHGAFLG